VASVAYQVDDAEPVEVAGHIARVRVTDDGQHTVRFHATDAAGNRSEEETVTVLVDRTAPTVEEVTTDGRAELVFDLADATSGLKDGVVEMRPTGREEWEPLRTSLHEGRLRAEVDPEALAGATYEFRATAIDLAGNRSASRTVTRDFPARPVPAPAPVVAPAPSTVAAPTAPAPAPPAKPRPVGKTKAKPRPKRCTRKSRSRRCHGKKKHASKRHGGRKRR
jgi:Big-like domain-containing protein